jgi:hypothetical protein
MGLQFVLVSHHPRTARPRLHWLYLRFSGQGPRREARARIRLERMTRLLSRAIERVYGVISAVDPPPKSKPVIY